MNYRTIAVGDDISLINQVEEMFREGDYGEVRAFVSSQPSQDTLQNLTQQLTSDGVTLTGPVVYDPDIKAIVVPFQKRMPALQLIGLSLGAMLVIGAMIFAWEIAQAASGNGLAAIWIVIGLVGFIIFIKSAEGKAVIKAGYGAAKHVGKVYTERRMFIDRPTRTDISKAVDQYHKDEAMKSASGGLNYSGKAGSSVESYGKVEDRYDQEQ
jgi:hypothetical protein